MPGRGPLGDQQAPFVENKPAATSMMVMVSVTGRRNSEDAPPCFAHYLEYLGIPPEASRNRSLRVLIWAEQLRDRQLIVLDNVSFEAEQGSRLAIMGPSGSGKTTLLGLCAGLDVPSSGKVSLMGFKLNAMREAHALLSESEQRPLELGVLVERLSVAARGLGATINTSGLRVEIEATTT